VLFIGWKPEDVIPIRFDLRQRSLFFSTIPCPAFFLDFPGPELAAACFGAYGTSRPPSAFFFLFYSQTPLSAVPPNPWTLSGFLQVFPGRCLVSYWPVDLKRAAVTAVFELEDVGAFFLFEASPFRRMARAMAVRAFLSE